MSLLLLSLISFSEAACRYGVTDESGVVQIMRNRLTVAVDATSPSGLTVPGYGTIAVMRFGSFPAGCGRITVEDVLIEVTATDEYGTSWPFYNELTVGGLGVQVSDSTRSFGPLAYAGYTWDGMFLYELLYTGIGSPFVVAAPRTVTFSADTTGASTPFDDSIQLRVRTVTWIDSDGNRITEVFDREAYALIF